MNYRQCPYKTWSKMLHLPIGSMHTMPIYVKLILDNYPTKSIDR
jgi:hypothetical protein